jgi:hypothetical protein
MKATSLRSLVFNNSKKIGHDRVDWHRREVKRSLHGPSGVRQAARLSGFRLSLAALRSRLGFASYVSFLRRIILVRFAHSFFKFQRLKDMIDSIDTDVRLSDPFMDRGAWDRQPVCWDFAWFDSLRGRYGSLRSLIRYMSRSLRSLDDSATPRIFAQRGK